MSTCIVSVQHTKLNQQGWRSISPVRPLPRSNGQTRGSRCCHRTTWRFCCDTNRLGVEQFDWRLPDRSRPPYSPKPNGVTLRSQAALSQDGQRFLSERRRHRHDSTHPDWDTPSLRITSYNVCYTKLLRFLKRLHFPAQLDAAFHPGREQENPRDQEPDGKSYNFV